MIEFFKAAYQAFKTWTAANPKTWAYIKALPVIAQGVQAHSTNKKLKRGQDILLTKFGTGAGIPVVYGTRRVAGTVVFMETVNNKELFVVYALAVGEVEKISDLKIDGRSIGDRSVYRDGFVLREEGNYFGGTVASENTADIGNVLGGSGGDNPRMVFNLHHGATDQEADPMLFHVFDGTNSRPNSWSADHKLSGIAYIAANYEYDTQGMFTGIPNLTAVVKGKKVLDTRTSTTGWSDNPALILHDYLTNDEYGKGIATANIDTTSFNTAANACEADMQTESYTNVTVLLASTSNDTFEISDEAVFDKIKTGANINFVANSITYFSGKVVDKDDSNFLYDEADDYGRTFFITLAEGSVTTAITSGTTGTITEVQDRFETNAVINTDETVLENTKDLIANMRGIFTYTNGTYAIKVEGTETPVLNLDEDDILETGIELAIENKEQKYNKVEVEFYNSSKNYEADTVVVEHSPLSDDGGEVLEHRVQFPYVTNQRIAYNHANAILNRSRNNRSIAFVATPKVLKANVGEVITITSSDLDLSQEQYRITQMTIQPDLNIQVSAVEYQGSIYGWNNPPAEVIARPIAPPDPYRVEAPTNFNFNQKSGSTPAFLSWDDATAYPSYEFSVKVYDATNQGGNVIRDGRVKEARFYLPELPKANGYSAEVIAINTLNIESDPTPLNSFNVTVDPVINDDIGSGAVDTDEIADDAITADKIQANTITANEIASNSITATELNVDNLGAISADLGTITSGSISIDTSASIKKFEASTSLVKIGSGRDEPQLRVATGNVTNALTFASESGEDGDKVSFALDNNGTITEKAFIKTDTGNASFQNLTFKGNLISGTTTHLTTAGELQNISSLDSITTTTIQNAVGGGTGDITSVTAGTNLTGGGTTGDVTLNLATNLSGLGTISSGDITIGGTNSSLTINGGTSYTNTSAIILSNGRTKIDSEIIDGTAQGDTAIKFSNRVSGTLAERMRIDHFGRVGINTNDPDGQGYSFAEDLVVLGGNSASDGVGITLRGNGKRYGVLAFGDNADPNSGEIFYDHTANSMSFRTNDQIAATIDSSRNATFAGDITSSGDIRAVDVNISGSLQNTVVPAEASVKINENGYADGTTYFRDLDIFDGKGNRYVKFDGSTQRVGIGTSGPSDLLQVGGDSNGIIRITGAGTGVDFGLNWASNQANIFSNTSDARLTFKTNGTERMRLMAQGSLLIGKTVVDNTTDGIRLDGTNNFVSFVRDGGEPLLLNRKTSDGSLLTLRKDGANVGVIGTQNWGIGTNTVSRGPLEIHKPSTGDCQIHLTNTSTGTGASNGTTIYANTNSGIWHRENGYFNIATNNTERLRIDSSGNVTVRSGNKLIVNRPDNAIGGEISYEAGSGFKINDANGDGTRFFVGSTENVRIDSSGRVGIGETSPATNLHIGDASTPKIRFSRTGSYYWDIGHTSSDFQFESQTGGVIMHMNFDGNVGIGETSPSAKLDVVGATATPLVLELSTGNSNCDITMQSANTSSVTRLRNNTNDFQIHTNGSERMRLDSSGNLLFNTTGTTGSDLSDGGVLLRKSTSTFMQIASGSTGETNLINFYKKSGSGIAGLHVIGTDRWGIGTESPNRKLDVAGEIGGIGKVVLQIDSNDNARFTDDQDNYIEFDGANFEMDFALDGTVQARLYDNGNFHIDGTLTQNSTQVPSDIKLKKNIAPINNALSLVDSLNGVHFDWRKDNKKAIGFIAQEVEKVLPELVGEVRELHNKEEKHKTVDYQSVIPVLVEAIKEQQAQIEALQEQINNI